MIKSIPLLLNFNVADLLSAELEKTPSESTFLSTATLQLADDDTVVYGEKCSEPQKHKLVTNSYITVNVL